MENIDISALSSFLSNLTWSTLFSAALTLAVCLIILKILLHIVRRALGHASMDDRLQKFILTGIRTVLYLVTLIIVAQSLGVPANSLVALLSVAALAVSLAVQGMLSNLAGGITLLTARPIAPGDMVEAGGVTGYVDELGLMYTKLHTDDGEVVVLPNSTISSASITNYTTLGRRRITVKIGVSYNAAADDVRRALLEAASSIDAILEEPAPAVYVSDYGDSAVEYSIFCWSAWDVMLTTRLRLLEAVKASLDRHGIEIPYNYLNVNLLNAPAPRAEDGKA